LASGLTTNGFVLAGRLAARPARRQKGISKIGWLSMPVEIRNYLPMCRLTADPSDSVPGRAVDAEAIQGWRGAKNAVLRQMGGVRHG
jgi:hypothetical protein